MCLFIIIAFIRNHKLRKIEGQIELGISFSNIILTTYSITIILMDKYFISSMPVLILYFGFSSNFTYNMLYIIIPLYRFKNPLKEIDYKM